MVEGFADRGEFGDEQLPVPRQPGVDDRDVIALDDQVAVDGVGADPAKAVRDFHTRDPLRLAQTGFRPPSRWRRQPRRGRHGAPSRLVAARYDGGHSPLPALEIPPVVPAEHVTPSRVRSFLNPRVGLIVLGGLVLLAGAAYLTAFAIVGGGVLPNTKVGDIAIGKMSRPAAQTKVAAALNQRATAQMALTAGGQPLSIDPAAAGLTVDAKATVAAGGRRHPTPAGLWRDMFAHHSLSPVLAVDSGKLDAAVTAFDGKMVGGGHDGGIKFDGVTPIAIPPVQGIALVHDKAVAAIRAAYFTTSAPVTLPVKSVQPSVTAEEVQRVLDDDRPAGGSCADHARRGSFDVGGEACGHRAELVVSSVGGHLDADTEWRRHRRESWG